MQEKEGTGVSATPTANLVTGLGLDEAFLRMTGSGTAAVVMGFLPDANNNTLHMTNRWGSVNDSYSYQPYGTTTRYGDSTNTQQYTGRENDGTGLYFYRARYYHPTFSRFVSEDPIEFAAGPNLYAYVGGDPISNIDPLGEEKYKKPPNPNKRPPPPHRVPGGDRERNVRPDGGEEHSRVPKRPNRPPTRIPGILILICPLCQFFPPEDPFVICPEEA